MAQNFYELELNDCDSFKNWSFYGDEDGSSYNLTGQYEGSAAFNLELGSGGPAPSGWAQITYAYNDLIGSKNLSNFDNVKFNFYVSDANLTALAGATARLGTDVSNFYYFPLTVARLSTLANPADGYWREITLSNLTAASSSGTADITNINFIGFLLQGNGSALFQSDEIRLDYWRATRYFQDDYDVELDGQGYQLLQKEGSYNRGKQPYSVDRYSTGDITYSNFDTYQYHAQTDWSAGWNDRYGLAENTFWDGQGLDISTVGELKNALQGIDITVVANSGYISAIQEYKQSAFVGLSNGANSSRIYSWNGSAGVNFSAVQTVARSAILDMAVYQGDLWTSIGQPQRTDATLLNFDGTTWSAVSSQSGIYFSQIGDTLYVAGAEGLMRSFDGSTWTTEFQQSGWEIHRMVSWRDKLWYLASLGHWKYWGQVKSALYSYDGVDRLLIQEFDDWCKPSIDVKDNKLWFTIGGILKSYDGENLVDEMDITSRYPIKSALDIYSSSTDVYDASDFGKGIQAIGNKLFVVNNSALTGSVDSQVLMNSGNGFSPYYRNGEEITALGTYTINTEKRLLIGGLSGHLQYLASENDSSKPYAVATKEASIVDAELFTIDKLFKSAQIFFNEISAGQSIVFQYKIDNEEDDWSTLGTVGTYDVGSTSIEFDFPPATTGKKLIYRLIIGGSASQVDTVFTNTTAAQIRIQDVVIKYLLAPDTKKKWLVKVMLPNNLQLNSGLREPSNGESLAASLETSMAKKEVLQYKDVDNQIYNVIINDVQIEGPYNVQTGRDSMGTNPEYVASIELLEG